MFILPHLVGSLISLGIAADHGAGAPSVREPDSQAHFIIRASDVDSVTRTRLTRMLEAERPRVLADLGMSSDKVVTIDMYPSHGALAQAAAARGVVMTSMPGFAFGTDQVHMLSPTALGWSRPEDTVSYMVHEFTHCLLVQRNPRIVDGPRWLSEAVATYEARYLREPQRWSWLVDSRAPALSAMNDPRDGRAIEVGYTVGQFIAQRWGTRAFAELVDQDGRLEGVLGLSQARFEAEWYAWLRTAYAL